MVRHSRLAMMVLVFTIVGLSWPYDAAAQRPRSSSRGAAVSRPAPPGSPVTGVAVPRNYGHGGYNRPYYPSRYFYPYYGGRYYYPYYRPYYYAPFYSYPYYSNFAFSFGFSWGEPYWGGYAYPYAYGYPYPYYGYYENTGSARLLITPRNAEVYVDGRFVGRVDDFDGSLQRLHIENGPHEIQVFLDGHRTFTQKVLFTRGTTVKIEHAMQPLSAGEAPEPKPAPTPGTQEPDRYQRQGPMPPSRPGQPAEFGTLALRVNPPDAEVLIDGELWERPAGESRLSVDLAEGPHQIEIRKAGYRSYTRTVDVMRGRTFTLNVSLSQGGPGGTPVSIAYPPAHRSGPAPR